MSQINLANLITVSGPQFKGITMLQTAQRRKTPCFFTILFTGLTCLAWPNVVAQDSKAESALQARNRLWETVNCEGAAAVPKIIEALDNEHKEVRLTAAHLAVNLGDSASAAFAPALLSSDAEVSRVIIDAIVRAGVLEQYITPIVTNEAASVRRYFYILLLPEHLLVDDDASEELIETFNKIYAGDLAEAIRSEILHNFYLKALKPHMLVEGKPSNQYIELLSSLYRNGSETARKAIIGTVSDLPITEASAQLLATANTKGENSEMARTARRAIIEGKLKTLEQLVSDKAYQQVLDKFAAEFSGEDFDAWPNDLAYEAFFIRSKAFRGLDKYASAIEDLERAVAYRPVKRAYRDLGYVYRDFGKPEKALEAFKNALASDVGSGGHVNHRSRLGAAAILRQLDRPEEALELLDEISNKIEDMGSFWGPSHVRSFAVTLENLGDYEAAIGYYRRMLEADFGEKQNQQAREAISALQEKSKNAASSH